MELFWSHGYAATGLNSLLEHMGIGRQSLYDTFGDKRSLFLESLHHYCKHHVGPVIAQIRAPGTVRGNLEAVFRGWIEEAREPGASGCFAGNSLAELGNQDLEVQALLTGYMAQVGEAFADLIRRGQQTGEVAGQLPADDLAMILVSMSQGMALMSQLAGEEASEASLDRAAAAMQSMVELLCPR